MARSVVLCYIQSSFPVVSTLICVTTADGNTILMALSSKYVTSPIRQKKSSLFLSLCNWKIYAKALRGGYLQKNGSRGALRFCIG